MKTPDEIKKGLEYCHSSKRCIDCKYDQRDFPFCVRRLLADAINGYEKLESRLAQVEMERDAAVDDCSRFPCATCSDQVNGDLCYNCNVCNDTTRTNYEWRGVCEENTKDGKDGQE